MSRTHNFFWEKVLSNLSQTENMGWAAHWLANNIGSDTVVTFQRSEMAPDCHFGYSELTAKSPTELGPLVLSSSSTAWRVDPSGRIPSFACNIDLLSIPSPPSLKIKSHKNKSHHAEFPSHHGWTYLYFNLTIARLQNLKKTHYLYQFASQITLYRFCKTAKNIRQNSGQRMQFAAGPYVIFLR